MCKIEVKWWSRARDDTDGESRQAEKGMPSAPGAESGEVMIGL